MFQSLHQQKVCLFLFHLLRNEFHHDLLIRPGGEKRISNYLLWQCAYSEFYFCDTLWPDFTEKEFDKALIAYRQRERRFGGLKQEKQK